MRLQLTAKTSNVPEPLSAAFTADELSLIIGTCVPDAVVILDRRNGRVVACNKRFDEVLERRIPRSGAELPLFEQFVHGDDRGHLRGWIAEDYSENDGRCSVRLLRADGESVVVSLHLSTFRWHREEFVLVFVRPVSSEHDVTLELKERISEQKRKTLEAIKSSLLIYQFTEKIKKTPLLTTTLLSTESEAQLFEKAARILTRDGLNYKDVTFLLVNEDRLEICYSTKPVAQEWFPLDADNHFTRFLQGGEEGLATKDSEILVPLQSRGSRLGVIAVTMHPRERIFFDELNLISEWQKDALLTIGDMIALLLDNLRLYREVRRQSITDTLTGVYNRHYFISRLSSEIKRCSRNGRPISLIFIDIDKFKTINDTYGHIQGDEVLKGLSAIFKKNIREYDCVCRYGGDEFVVLLPEVGGEQAHQTGLKLLERVREHDFSTREEPPRQIDVSISLGVTVMDHDLDEKVFLKSADDALYEAKKRGRNQLVFAEGTPECRPS